MYVHTTSRATNLQKIAHVVHILILLVQAPRGNYEDQVDEHPVASCLQFPHAQLEHFILEAWSEEIGRSHAPLLATGVSNCPLL